MFFRLWLKLLQVPSVLSQWSSPLSSQGSLMHPSLRRASSATPQRSTTSSPAVTHWNSCLLNNTQIVARVTEKLSQSKKHIGVCEI